VVAVVAEHVGGAALAERSGERIAKLPVVCLQPMDAAGGRLQAAQQRRVRGTLALRRRGRCGRVPLAEPLDLGSQVVLGVEPGS
jgi:hypothetical protein